MLNQISIWLSQELCLEGIHEANVMARVGEKGGARAHAGKMAIFAFDAQFLLLRWLDGYTPSQPSFQKKSSFPLRYVPAADR